jgi:uncharacterized phage-associated protein
MDSAINIAKAIINESHRQGKSITNRALQNLLYLCQGRALENGQWAIFDMQNHIGLCGEEDERILCGDIFPYVPSVYNYFSRYIGEIPQQEEPNLWNKDEEIVKYVVGNFHSGTITDTLKLTETIKNQDPYKYMHQIFGRDAKIPLETMRDYFETKH